MRGIFKGSKPFLMHAVSGCARGCACGGCLGTLRHPRPRKMVPSFFLPEIHAPKVGAKINSLLILPPRGFFYTLRVNEPHMGHPFAPPLMLGTPNSLHRNPATPVFGRLLTPAPFQCPKPNEEPCFTGRECFNSKLKCDGGEPDCSDGSDESTLACGGITGNVHLAPRPPACLGSASVRAHAT